VYAQWPKNTLERIVDSKGVVNADIAIRFVQCLEGQEDMTPSVMDTSIKWLTREVNDMKAKINVEYKDNVIRCIPAVSKVSLGFIVQNSKPLTCFCRHAYATLCMTGLEYFQSAEGEVFPDQYN